MLRATLVLLVMLNLAAAGWWLVRPVVAGAGAAAHASAAIPEPSLRLVGEPVAAAVTSAPPGSATTAAPTVPDAAAATPAASSSATASTASPMALDAPAATADAAPVCLRFGPFASDAARDDVRVALARLGVQAIPRDAPSRAARGWKVFLPPLPSREAAVAMAERLRAAGVSDMYVLNQGDEANGIALGRYGSEEAARRRQADLRAKGITDAQAQAIGDTPAQAWLQARLPAQHDRATLARVAASTPLDCARLR